MKLQALHVIMFIYLLTYVSTSLTCYLALFIISPLCMPSFYATLISSYIHTSQCIGTLDHSRRVEVESRCRALEGMGRNIV